MEEIVQHRAKHRGGGHLLADGFGRVAEVGVPHGLDIVHQIGAGLLGGHKNGIGIAKGSQPLVLVGREQEVCFVVGGSLLQAAAEVQIRGEGGAVGLQGLFVSVQSLQGVFHDRNAVRGQLPCPVAEDGTVTGGEEIKGIGTCGGRQLTSLGMEPSQLLGEGEQTVVEGQEGGDQIRVVFGGSQTVAEIGKGILPEEGEGVGTAGLIRVFEVEFVNEIPHDPLAEGEKLGIVGDTGGGRKTQCREVGLDGLTAEGVDGADVGPAQTDELALEVAVPGILGNGLRKSRRNALL